MKKLIFGEYQRKISRRIRKNEKRIRVLAFILLLSW